MKKEMIIKNKQNQRHQQTRTKQTITSKLEQKYEKHKYLPLGRLGFHFTTLVWAINLWNEFSPDFTEKWWRGSFHTRISKNVKSFHNDFSQFIFDFTEIFLRNYFVKSAVRFSQLISLKIVGELIVKSKKSQRYCTAILQIESPMINMIEQGTCFQEATRQDKSSKSPCVLEGEWERRRGGMRNALRSEILTYQFFIFSN